MDRFLKDTLGRYVEYVPVCPEVECGLGVPRECMHLEGVPENPRLVTTKSGADVTGRMKRWASRRVKELESEGLSGFVFKSRSPSSGMERVSVFDKKGQPVKRGVGIFARAFMEHFPHIPVQEEGRLHDPDLRENFIEAIFTLGRWRDLRQGRKTVGNLVRFHSDHKLLLLSLSRGHHAAMVRLVASGKSMTTSELYDRYGDFLFQALRFKATRRKNPDVLMHAMGISRRLFRKKKRRNFQTRSRFIKPAGSLSLCPLPCSGTTS